MIKLLSIRFYIVIFFVFPFTEASGSSFKDQPFEISKEKFLELLENEETDALMKHFSSDRELVLKSMESLSSKDRLILRKHWAAESVGGAISSSFLDLIKAAKALDFKHGDTLIDIGCGHGYPALVFGAFFPYLKVVGIDIVRSKVELAKLHAKKLALKNVQFVHQDISEEHYKLPIAENYYLFNPLNYDLTEAILESIKTYSRKKLIRIILFKGGWTRKMLDEKATFKGRIVDTEVRLFEI